MKVSFPVYKNSLFNLKSSNFQTSIKINSLKEDAFIKSSSSVSFKGSAQRLEEKFEPLKKDLTKYVTSTDEIDSEIVEKLIQKYSPDTKFFDLSELKQDGTNADFMTMGYTKQQMIFYVDEKGKFRAKKTPQEVYVPIPRSPGKNEKTMFLARILHECTHVFQQESKNQTSYEEFYNSCIKKSKDLEIAQNTLYSVNPVFNMVQQQMTLNFAMGLAHNQEVAHIPSVLNNKNIDIDTIFKKQGYQSARIAAKNFIKAGMIGCKQKIGEADYDTILDFVAKKAEYELQAYRNELRVYKEALGIKSKTDLDLRLEMYETIIDAVREMKSSKGKNGFSNSILSYL